MLSRSIRLSLACLALGASLSSLATPPASGASAQTEKKQFVVIAEVKRMFDEAKALAAENKFAESIKRYEEGIAKAAELKDAFSQGKGWYDLGLAYYSMGRLKDVKRCFETSIVFFDQAGDEYDSTGAAMGLGVVAENSGDYPEARKRYLPVLARYRATGDKVGLAKITLNLGMLESYDRKFPEAIQYLTEAKQLYHDQKDLRWEIQSTIAIGEVKESQDDQLTAIKMYEEAARLAHDNKFPAQEASATENLGTLYRTKGEYAKALPYFERVLKLREETKNLRRRGAALIDLGIIYDLMGRSELALAKMREAIAQFRELNDERNLAFGLQNYGVALVQAKKYDEAEPILIESIDRCRELKDKTREAACLGTLATIYRVRKQYDKGLEVIAQSRKLYEGSRDFEAIGTTYDNEGSLYKAQHKFDRAIESYQKALGYYEAVNNTNFAASTYTNMGATRKDQGQLANAEANYRRGIALIEDTRAKLGASDEGKAEYLGRRLDTYQDFIELLAIRGKIKEAFEFSQRTKARSLIDLLSAGKVSAQEGMTAAERAQERALRLEADRINADMVKEGAINEVGAKKRFAALKLELAAVENKISAFATSLFARHPELVVKRAVKTASIQEVAANLPADTALLEYVGGSANLVFIVSNEHGKPKLSWAKLGDTEKVYASQASQLRAALSNPKLPYESLSKLMYKTLITPAEASLKGKKRLIICPDGPLWEVPFGVLSNGKFLAESFELDYSYSATGHSAALQSRKPTSKPGSMLILANPNFGGIERFGDDKTVPGKRPIEPPSRPIEPPSRPIEPPSRPIEPPSRPIEPPSRDLEEGLRAGIVDLPGTQIEAQAIAKQYPQARVLLRSEAQESTFLRTAKNYRYLHLASHAFFNDASPMLSSIVLSVPNAKGFDGYLTAREIFDLRLNADLVVLSACNTARGTSTNGDGLIGLSWALLAAGAPAQVVSQWSVDDRATATLMTRFYGNLKRGQKKGEALRNASLSLTNPKLKGNQSKWRHPYYWAPFVLIGDWR